MIIRVSVTAEDIAAALSDLDKDPIERSLTRRFGEATEVDNELPGQMWAVVGTHPTTLIVTLPPVITDFIARWDDDQPVEPFDYEIDIGEWLPRSLGVTS